MKFELIHLRYIQRMISWVASSFSIVFFKDIPIRGLYPTAALLSHDCVSNTFIALDSTRSIKIYSSVDITEGDPIWNNYTHALSVSI